jgi:hypothetical protein
MAHAACKSVGVRTYVSDDDATLELARAVCAGCPVRQEGDDVAMADPSLVGVRGGWLQRRGGAGDVAGGGVGRRPNSRRPV